MKARCISCGEWFPITRELDELIQEGIISPVDVNLCQECAELEAEYCEFEEELYSIINSL